MTAHDPQTRTIWAWTSATFFGIGFIGKGGGTVASVVTVALWLAAAQVLSATFLPFATAAAAVVITLLGIPVATIVAGESGKKDPSEVVLDEVSGQLFALIAVPLDWKYVLASLILFRVFDILKPPPIRQLEKLPGGAGIVLDDVAAGGLALIVLQVLARFQVLG